MDHLLKRIQKVHPAAFCSQDFFLLNDNMPAHKTEKRLAIFDPQKMSQPFIIPHTLQIYLHQTIFYS